MTEESCLQAKPFGVDFQNLAFEISRSRKNESDIHLPTEQFQSIRSPNGTQLIIERTDLSRTLPTTWMLIDAKINHSIILIEREEGRKSIQTGNVTVIFNHRVRWDDLSDRLSTTRPSISSLLVIGIALSMPRLSSKRCLISSRVHYLCSLLLPRRSILDLFDLVHRMCSSHVNCSVPMLLTWSVNVRSSILWCITRYRSM